VYISAWEEKNLTEQKMNLDNNPINDQSDTMRPTKKKLTKNLWIDIGKKSGIYKIRNKINDKYYVGSSQNVQHRWKNHLKTLRNKTHRNSKLQNSWYKYGEECFIFELIEECPISDLLIVEQNYLDECKKNPENNYMTKVKS
jgi:hypothetical protein